MSLLIPDWLFTILPLAIMLAALFWGAPLIALVSELTAMITGKPFPARCAQQMSRLAVAGHGAAWICAAMGGAFLWQHPFWSSEFVSAHQMIVVLTAALPLCGTALLVAYNITWKTAKQKRAIHFGLGCLANIPLKYAYWGTVILALVYFRGTPLENLAFIPAANSALWPTFILWVPLSLYLSAGFGLCYLLLRREKDDWGRDYYRFAAPFLAKWLLITAMCCLIVQAWLFLSLKGIMNLQLPQILIPAAASVACTAMSMALALNLASNEHPMRLKGSMIGIILLSYLQTMLLTGAIFETLSHYVPGWSLPTFIPTLLRYLPL